MAFYNPYQQNYYPTYQQQATQQPQIQNGGFVSAPNEVFARNYAVAHGTSVTFKDETLPYIYTKTMGFSQMEQPIFEKYRLVKEEISETSEVPAKDNDKLLDSISYLKDEIKALWGEIEGLKNEPKKTTPKRKDNTGGED